MDVLMVAAELAPYVRATPAADSVAALAKTLRQLGHSVTLALPRSPGFQGSGPLLARRLSPLVIEPGLEVTVLDGQLPSGVGLVLFDAPEFSLEQPLFGASERSEDDGKRAVLFARAAAALVRERLEHGKRVDVVHAHDWPAAPVAALLAESGAAPSVLTLHAFGEEPSFEPLTLAGLGAALGEPRARVAGRISPLRIGLSAARAATTVSPSYARELEAGALGPLLKQLPEGFAGVLEGVDYATFSPATDPAVESRFDAEDVSNKGRCKTALVRACGLRLETERALLLIVLEGATAAEQTLLLKALPRILELPLGLVIVGAARGALASALDGLQKEYASDLGVSTRNDETEIRRCLAAADFVVSLRAGAAGASLELAAQRYGALPIATASGGALDAIVDTDSELETGTGFLYAPGSSDELVGGVQRALSAFGNPRFASLRRRVMRRDVGWDRPARRYVQIYRRAMGEKIS